MEIIALLVGFAVAATAISRWTRVHPLLVALAGGLAMAALGGAAMAAFTREGGAILLIAGTAFVMGTGSAGVGAFTGWQRRRYIERIS